MKPHDMTPAERWEFIEANAPTIYGKKWKSLLSNDLDMTAQTISKWARQGAPVWAAVLIDAKMDQQELYLLRKIIRGRT